MSEILQFNLQVGDDGVLHLNLNLGEAEAKKQVLITISPAVIDRRSEANSPAWTEFINQTYGSLEGLNVERPAQGSFEQREPIE